MTLGPSSGRQVQVTAAPTCELQSNGLLAHDLHGFTSPPSSYSLPSWPCHLRPHTPLVLISFSFSSVSIDCYVHMNEHVLVSLHTPVHH